MRGSRRRLRTFCDLANVSKAGLPSWKPYHMATTCGRPSAISVATDMDRRPWRNSSTSSSDILISSRLDAIGSAGLLQQLWCDRAVDAADGLGRREPAPGADHAVDQVEWDDLVVDVPRVGLPVVEPADQSVPQPAGQETTDPGDEPDGRTGVAPDGGRGPGAGHGNEAIRSDGRRLEQDHRAVRGRRTE